MSRCRVFTSEGLICHVAGCLPSQRTVYISTLVGQTRPPSTTSTRRKLCWMSVCCLRPTPSCNSARCLSTRFQFHRSMICSSSMLLTVASLLPNVVAQRRTLDVFGRICCGFFVCQYDNLRTRMMKLGGRCVLQRSRPSLNLGVKPPRGPHPSKMWRWATRFGKSVRAVQFLLSLVVFVCFLHVCCDFGCHSQCSQQPGNTCF